jgi:hypothetical protein
MVPQSCKGGSTRYNQPLEYRDGAMVFKSGSSDWEFEKAAD